MYDVAIPLGLTASYEGRTAEEEQAAQDAGDWSDHYGYAVVTLNGTTPVIRLPLGFVDWGEESPREAMEQAVAGWLAGRTGGQS